MNRREVPRDGQPGRGEFAHEGPVGRGLPRPARFAFDGDTLRTAIAAAFPPPRDVACGRGGRPPCSPPTTTSTSPPARGRRWRELRQQIAIEIDGPDRLEDVGEELRRFLGAGLRQPDQGEPVHAGMARWRTVAAGAFKLGREAKAVIEVTGRVGEQRPRHFPPYPRLQGVRRPVAG